jgi:hypothetical protein
MVTPRTRRPNSPSPADIAKKVENFLVVYAQVHARMDADFELAIGHGPTETKDSDEDEREYKSNDPVTFLKKATALLSDAALVRTVGDPKAHREARSQHNNKERVAIGFLNQADERLMGLGITEGLRGLMAWFTCVRGMLSGRMMLVKPKDGGSAFVDLTPWDPKRVSWAYGANGLSWVIHTVGRTVAQIKEEYGVSEVVGADVTKSEDEEVIFIHDFYDSQINKVTTDKQVLKKATIHGAKTPPAYVVPVGGTPIIVPENGLPALENVGESIYEANRDIYAKKDRLNSILFELAGRSVKPPILVKSPGGDVVLPEEPFKKGLEINVDTDTDVAVMNLHEASQDVGNLLGIMSAEAQRGSFPVTAFGDLQFALSGFAINSLSQGIATVLKPMLKAMETAYTQIVNGLLDQYDTGAFEAMELTGVDNNDKWFSETIEPETIRGLPAVKVRLTATLPKDDVGKAGLALQLFQGGIYDQRTSLDVMEVEDPDLIIDRTQDEAARRATPMAAYYQMMLSSAREGDETQADIYEILAKSEFIKLQIQLQQLQLAAASLGGGGQPGGQQQPRGLVGPSGQPVRFDPQVAPNSAIGVQPPQPTPQAGPVVEPGRARPFAQNGSGP